MLDYFKSLLGAGSCLGVDIGTTSVKMAEIGMKSGKPTLLNYGILETHGHLKRLNDAIQTSSLQIESKETAELLRELVSKAGFKATEVIASLPAFSAFVTLLEFPTMSEADMKKALKFQIPQYIPLSPEEMNIDWLKIGDIEDEKGIIKQQILLISVPNDRIRRYQEIFKLANLRLKMLEVETLSLVRVLSADVAEPALIVDIGSRSTNIIITEKGSLRHSAQTEFAGASLTQAVANGLGIDAKRAEEIKKQRGLLVRGAEYELSTLTLPYLDAIIGEVRRVKASFEKNPNAKISQVILAGGGANLLGIDRYFEEQLGLKTSIGNPFERVGFSPQLELFIKELGPLLGVAIGLGTKEFI
jgi:type IV pilus assembly protein PilM